MMDSEAQLRIGERQARFPAPIHTGMGRNHPLNASSRPTFREG